MRPSVIIPIAVLVLVASACNSERDRDPGVVDQHVMTDYDRDPIERGRATYMGFCASCHGEDGSGSGPVAEFLTVPLDDLRYLKEQHGGTFPVELIYQMIDGREEVRAHGTREMPVWGNVWTEQEGEPVPQEFVEARINELTEYLRSIQITEEVDPDV